MRRGEAMIRLVRLLGSSIDLVDFLIIGDWNSLSFSEDTLLCSKKSIFPHQKLKHDSIVDSYQKKNSMDCFSSKYSATNDPTVTFLPAPNRSSSLTDINNPFWEMIGTGVTSSRQSYICIVGYSDQRLYQWR